MASSLGRELSGMHLHYDSVATTCFQQATSVAGLPARQCTPPATQYLTRLIVELVSPAASTDRAVAAQPPRKNQGVLI